MTNKQITLQLMGLDCSSCVIHIEDVLENITGVIHAKMSFAASKVEIAYDPSQVSAQELITTMKQAGYSETKLLD